MSAFLLPPINDLERQGIAKIREVFRDELPRDLDTDFNLQRWVRGWKGDMKEIEPRLRGYIQNRKALKVDGADLLEQPTNPLLRRAFKHISVSVQTTPLINPIDNTIVLIYRFENLDIVGLTKIFTPSQYLGLTFIMNEYLIRQVLKQEAISGKPSGVSIIHDFHGLRIGDFINPSAPHMKLGALTMALQQDYFCDMLHQVICVRGSTLMNIVWEVVKRFLNEQTIKKFCFYSESNRLHIFERLHPSCVPVFYGGEYRETEETTHPDFRGLQIDADKGATIAAPITESEYFKNSWTPEWTVEHIKPKQTFTIVKSIKDAKMVLKWQLDAYYNVEFAVYHEKAGHPRQLVVPKLVLCTPHFPEENHLSCQEYGPGDYTFEFTNVGTSWFSLKLSYCIKECAE